MNISVVILCIILVFLGTLIGCCIYYRPKLKTTKEIDEFTQKENEKLWRQRDTLQAEIKRDQTLIQINKETLKDNEKTAAFWSQRLLEMQEEVDKGIKAYEAQAYATAEKQLQKKLEDLETQYEKAETEYKDEYYQTLKDAAWELSTNIFEKTNQRDELDKEIALKESTVASLIEDAKRQFEEEHKKDYYRLCLSNEDVGEIQELRKVVQYLRNPEPLNKVIWKVYYEKPYTDLIGRVVGSGCHTGIYKITNMDNQMCYIGQAANIADRWKTHIKRGLGAEPLVNNKLYPAMIKYGVENFTFEIIEECERNKLNEREDYWQEVFKAKEFGYSIK